MGIAPVEPKRAVIQRMTEVLVEEPGRDREHVFVLVDEVETDSRGCEGQSVTEPLRAGTSPLGRTETLTLP